MVASTQNIPTLMVNWRSIRGFFVVSFQIRFALSRVFTPRLNVIYPKLISTTEGKVANILI